MSNTVLFVATVDYHFEKFHLPYMQWFQEQGWKVHVAANGDMNLPNTDRKFRIPIQRSPGSWRNLKAYGQLRKLIEEHRYDVIHCHTPMGGVLARMAARQARKRGTKVIYTAHGFHFCQGAPLANWLLYYPVEKWLSAVTDCLITINQEDYELADRREFRAARLAHVHGVGVDTSKYKPAQPRFKAYLRAQYGYSHDELLLFYAAEFNANKNHQLLIRAFADMQAEIPEARLLLAGDGPLKSELQAVAERLGVKEKIDFLGYRHDIQWLLPMCDIAVASSLREGLPVNILEAMAVGLPVVATANRGHSELIENQLNGFVVPPDRPQPFAEALKELGRSEWMRQRMGFENTRRIQKYALPQVERELANIYSSYMSEAMNETQSQHYRAYL